MKLKLIAAAALASMTVAPAFSGTASHTLNATATVNGNCKFQSASSALAFGAIDPSGTGSKTATSTFNYRCTKGTTATGVTSDDGLNESSVGNPRLLHTSVGSEYIPYTLGFSSLATAGTGHGTGNDISFTVTGTILEANYVNAQVGAYADTVVLTITP